MAEINPEAQRQAAGRLAATEKEREATRRYVSRGELLKADTPERLEKRKTRLLADQNLSPTLGPENRFALAENSVLEAPEGARRAFERQIGGKDTQPCWFLTKGVEVRRRVGRIHIRDARRRVGWGTGFLVAPNLLVTNQHVLDSLDTARCSRVEFDHEETFEGEILPSAIFDFAPSVLFMSDPASGGLDYALIAVESRARPDSGRPDAELAEFGYHALARAEGKLIKGELIHSIHHPEGQPRQVSLRENRLMAIQDPALQDIWMHYETDTEQGSSGAPLYNNQWEVVGIHHMGVEKRDQEGKILAIGGGRWTAEMGGRQKWWQANEGLRISRFIAHVEAQVKALRDTSAPPPPDQVVTKAGLALVEEMLMASSSSGAGPAPATTTESVSPARPAATSFSPE
ncbi:MAG: trypsin-like serine peptidase [Pseudonocardiaceae bacterium]